MNAPDPLIADLPPITPRDNTPYFDLRGAMLCMGCDVLYPGTVGACPKCGSPHRFAVERVLEPASAAHVLDLSLYPAGALVKLAESLMERALRPVPDPGQFIPLPDKENS